VSIEDGGEGVAVLRLSRPEKRNALTPAMLDSIVHYCGQACDSALVLAGEGRVFCAGFDLDLCEEDPDTLRALLSGLSEAILAMRRLKAPVVVAAHGAAIAGGCALLGGADVVVADRGAKLGYPVARIGVSPAVSGPFLRKMVGDGAARERLLEPGLISGEEGARLGLIHHLVEDREEVLSLAVEVARALARKPSGSLAATKAWLWELGEADAGGAAERAASVSVGLVGGEEERRLLREARRGRT